ncbi:hypothetical protein [Glutamicibacter sp. NPDC087344]|uniref:hypothetical protein n=1 Tax=Glutamicibacter sp. NPDC087344 TaxID=3363994 RepID=UPI0038083C8B
MARQKAPASEAGTISARELPSGTWQAETRYRLLGGSIERIRRNGETKGKAMRAVRDEIARIKELGSGGAQREGPGSCCHHS